MERVNLTFIVLWQFREIKHLKVTKCKKIINAKTGKLLKYTTRGFYINGEYLKRKDINKHVELIPSTKTPF